MSFLVFLVIVLSFYAFLISYTYYRIIRPYTNSFLSKGYLITSVLVIILLFVGRYTDKTLIYSVSYWSVLLGLLWLGFSLYMFISTLILDAYKGFVELSKRFLGINPIPKPSGKLAFFIVLFLSLSLSAYSYYETLNLEVERVKIYTDKLPEGVDRIKIMHISDMHLGPVMGLDKVRLVKRVWEKEKPDIIVDTGDLVDGNLREKLYLAEELYKMQAPYGKFAVMGNHDYFRDWEQAIEFMRRSGYRVLKDESVDIGVIRIVGVDDDACKLVGACSEESDEYQILKGVKRDKFVLLLKHKPKLNSNSIGHFDLMLSGHTHGGVYLPIGKLILDNLFLTDRGFVNLGKGSYIFVSKGVGTGGPPMRFFSPPDVAIIDIQKKVLCCTIPACSKSSKPGEY